MSTLFIHPQTKQAVLDNGRTTSHVSLINQGFEAYEIVTDGPVPRLAKMRQKPGASVYQQVLVDTVLERE